MKQEIIGQGAVVVLVVAIVAAVVGGAIGYLLSPGAEAPPDIAELEAEISELKGTVSGLEGTVSGLEGTVSTQEGKISDLEAELAAIPPKPGEGLYFTYVDHGDPADPFHAKIVRGWEEAASTLGVDAVANYAYGDHAKTLEYIDAAISAGVDGIFIFSVDPEGVHPYITKALDKGISVVLMSSRDPVYTPDEVPFVGTDLTAQGYTVGQYLAKQLESGANIVFFSEFIAPYSEQRRAGTLEALDDAGITYNEIDWYEVGVDYASVRDTVKTHLLAHPETDAILGLGSLATAAGGITLMELGYEPGEIKWVGYDLVDDTVTGIKAGYGAANVNEVFMNGYYGCLALYLKTKYELCAGDITVATAMVDPANIADFEYWVEQGIK